MQNGSKALYNGARVYLGLEARQVDVILDAAGLQMGRDSLQACRLALLAAFPLQASRVLMLAAYLGHRVRVRSCSHGTEGVLMGVAGDGERVKVHFDGTVGQARLRAYQVEMI